MDASLDLSEGRNDEPLSTRTLLDAGPCPPSGLASSDIQMFSSYSVEVADVADMDGGRCRRALRVLRLRMQ